MMVRGAKQVLLELESYLQALDSVRYTAGHAQMSAPLSLASGLLSASVPEGCF